VEASSGEEVEIDDNGEAVGLAEISDVIGRAVTFTLGADVDDFVTEFTPCEVLVVIAGSALGLMVGSTVDISLGSALGNKDGDFVGLEVGVFVDSRLGCSVGDNDGFKEGVLEGSPVGLSVNSELSEPPHMALPF